MKTIQYHCPTDGSLDTADDTTDVRVAIQALRDETKYMLLIGLIHEISQHRCCAQQKKQNVCFKYVEAKPTLNKRKSDFVSSSPLPSDTGCTDVDGVAEDQPCKWRPTSPGSTRQPSRKCRSCVTLRASASSEKDCPPCPGSRSVESSGGKYRPCTAPSEGQVRGWVSSSS